MKINSLVILSIMCVMALGPASAADSGKRGTGSDAATNAAASTPTDYLLGPGDVLQIYVWRNPELSISIPVRPDGKISTPLVEDLVAIGKTPSQLARDIETALSEYVLAPKVNVIVTASTSAASQVKVIGQVRAPQSVPFRAGMRVLDAIIAVGGLTDFAAGNRTRILRRSPDNQEQIIKVHVGNIIKGKLKDNFALYAGDVIVVPETLF